jgi:putative tryptophan/tyrosine transport system substrate-binding protein
MAATRRRLPITRRRFVQGAGVAGLGLLAGCGRLPWQEQAAPKVSRVGVLSVSTDPSDAENVAFREGLRDLGYSEGQNLTLEWRFFGTRIEQWPELAADLVNLSVDVIVAQGNTACQAAQQASVTIPVVMAFSSDPVRARLVATLAHPGGHVTGLASLTGVLGAKRLELLRC